jgi:hypothetical protein
MKNTYGRRYAIVLIGLLAVCCIVPVLLAEDKPGSSTDELVQQIKDYQKEVEDIRGKKFKTDVPVHMQSEEDFRKFVAKSLDAELPPEKTKLIQSAWSKLGLIPNDYDLRKGFENLFISQAAGYYDHSTKKMVLLKTDTLSPDHIKISLIHELCHALQDQYFDLGTLMNNAGATSEDAGMAIRYLIEGEATYVMTYYATKPMMALMPKNMSITQVLSQQTAVMKSISREFLLGQTEAQFGPKVEQYPAMKSVIDGLKDAPIYLFWYLNAPYMHGAASIAEMLQLPISVKQDEFVTGWIAVDNAYKTPPVSSEQMIHPNKLLVSKDAPTSVNQPALPDGWEPAYSDVLGEFGFWVLYEIFEIKRSRDYSEGWDGDRYTLIKNKKDGRLGLHLATAWDSDADAKDSFKAYQKIVAKKYADWQKDKNATDQSVTWNSPDGKSAVVMTLENTKWTAVEDIPAETADLWKTPPKKD